MPVALCARTKSSGDPIPFKCPELISSSSSIRWRNAGVASVNPFNNNEPLIDPRLLISWNTTRRRLPGALIRIYSNGALLTRRVAGELAGSGLSQANFSLHASTELGLRTVMGMEGLNPLRTGFSISEGLHRESSGSTSKSSISR